MAFFLATQTVQFEECNNSSSCRTLKYRLPKKAKYYLVPSLAQDKIAQSGQLQEAFVLGVDKASFERIFPKNTNPDLDSMTRVTDHFMPSAYMPFIYYQLVELVCLNTVTKNMVSREVFRQQMEMHNSDTPEQEWRRNRCFMDMQALLPTTLAITESTPEGKNALRRFSLQFEKSNLEATQVVKINKQIKAGVRYENI